jgi:hypothetical protein
VLTGFSPVLAEGSLVVVEAGVAFVGVGVGFVDVGVGVVLEDVGSAIAAAPPTDRAVNAMMLAEAITTVVARPMQAS